MEIVRKITLIILLIAGPDVKLAMKKSALYKKENENGKLRILEHRKNEKKEKRKKNYNVIPKESAHYKNVHIDILPLNCVLVLSLSPPLGHLPVGVEGGGLDCDPQARANAVIAPDGDVNRILRIPNKRDPFTQCKSCSGMTDNTPSNLRPVVCPGGGGEGGGEEGQEPATEQTPGEFPGPGQTGTRLGPAQARIQTSAHSNHCCGVVTVVTGDSQVTRQVCQVTNYDRHQDKREHPERVCTKVESLMFIFTCETKFTTSSLSVNCDKR